jgi:hypothetical protein
MICILYNCKYVFYFLIYKLLSDFININNNIITSQVITLCFCYYHYFLSLLFRYYKLPCVVLCFRFFFSLVLTLQLAHGLWI